MKNLIDQKAKLRKQIAEIENRIKIADAYMDYAEPFEDLDEAYLTFCEWCNKVAKVDPLIMKKEIENFEGEEFYDKILEYQEHLDDLYINLTDAYDNVLDKIDDQGAANREKFTGNDEEWE